ncbi:MAG TPA: glycosidase [Bacteroidales bacterium]|jgi:predicted GH43/DUF377 family glycosyl hydrolase|nr:glycosidase [Bacteroidales bacterium]
MLIERYINNPILTREDVPYPVATVHNAAVIKYDGKYIMIFRSHKLNGRSILGKATSSDGFNFKVNKKPFMLPAVKGIFSEYEAYGIEDPRIVYVDGEFLITYSAYSKHGVRIGLAKTKDFQSIERVSLITEADYRNVVIFPEKIGGLYARLDRPHSEISPWSIWISYSPDLKYWGESKLIMKPMQYHWDEMKIGPGAPPIKTTHGWLHIYHGVFPTMDGSVYRLGAAIHDLEDPSVILAVGDDWILQPEEDYEITGYVHNVVFCCGAVPEDDGSMKIYWGGADNVMCVGTVKIQKLVDHCFDNSRNPLG